MIRRLIIAFRAPRDYADPGTREELTDKAMDRVKILHRRIAVDYYRGKLSEIRILTEAHRFDDLHAMLLSEQFKDQPVTLDHFVEYSGLCQEMKELKEDETPDQTVIIYLHTESLTTSLFIKRWNEMCLFTQVYDYLHMPDSEDDLAVIIDHHQFKKTEWIRATTMLGRPKITQP